MVKTEIKNINLSGSKTMTIDQLDFLNRAHNQSSSAMQNIRDAHIDCTALESIVLLQLIMDAQKLSDNLKSFISAVQGGQ
jgi:hypothetical protein